ncbi:hypothetical protein ACQEVC_33615 [Plantactinospora sp. CA-294935]|uniref:DUF346 domain-containing protein n=1 Tax=Plantactinospora sp. CA-294935 TaxID=3240012 RepID=UPI003D9154E1
MALIRSASDGSRPFVGSVVTSPTLKIPNCIASSSLGPGRQSPDRPAQHTCRVNYSARRAGELGHRWWDSDAGIQRENWGGEIATE